MWCVCVDVFLFRDEPRCAHPRPIPDIRLFACSLSISICNCQSHHRASQTWRAPRLTPLPVFLVQRGNLQRHCVGGGLGSTAWGCLPSAFRDQRVTHHFSDWRCDSAAARNDVSHSRMPLAYSPIGCDDLFPTFYERGICASHILSTGMTGAPGGWPVWSRIGMWGLYKTHPRRSVGRNPWQFLTVVPLVAHRHQLVPPSSGNGRGALLLLRWQAGLKAQLARCDNRRLQKIKYALHPPSCAPRAARLATGYSQQLPGLGVHMQVINCRPWNTERVAFGISFCSFSSFLVLSNWILRATTMERVLSLRVNQVERWSYQNSKLCEPTSDFTESTRIQEDSSRM